MLIITNSDRKNRLAIRNILTKNNTNKTDLLKMRQILISCGALRRCEKEIVNCLNKADTLISSCRMKTPFKNTLHDYSQQILKLS